MEKTAVIFDMDGVLIASEEFFFQRRLNFFREKQLVPGSRELTDYVGKTEAGIWLTLVKEDEELRSQLHQEYRAYQEQHPIDYLQALRPEVRPLLRQLQLLEVPLAIASSSPKANIEQMLTVCSLTEYFDYVVSGDEVAGSKPEPDIYLQAMKYLKAAAYIAVEDSPVGIQAAKAAGIYTVALQQKFPLDQSQADERIAELSQLLKIFEKNSN